MSILGVLLIFSVLSRTAPATGFKFSATTMNFFGPQDFAVNVTGRAVDYRRSAETLCVGAPSLEGGGEIVSVDASRIP